MSNNLSKMKNLPYQQRLAIYERFKQSISHLGLTPKQYEQRIKFVVEVLAL